MQESRDQFEHQTQEGRPDLGHVPVDGLGEPVGGPFGGANGAPDRPWASAWAGGAIPEPGPVPALLLAPFMPVTVVRRQLLENGMGAAWLLFVYLGFLRALEQAADAGMGDRFAMTSILAISAIGAVFGGLLQGLFGGWLLRLSCKAIGGAATSRELRIALIWGSYPALIAGTAIWVAVFRAYGHSFFTSSWTTSETDALPGTLALGGLLGALWAFVNMSRTVGAANGFSGWKGCGALVLSGLFLLAIGVVILGVVWVFFGP